MLGLVIGFVIPVISFYIFRTDTYFTLVPMSSDSSILIIPFMIVERLIYGALIGWIYGRLPKKIRISFLAVVILIFAAVFLPIYNGRVICGFNPSKGCWNQKLDLIEYIKFKKELSVASEAAPISKTFTDSTVPSLSVTVLSPNGGEVVKIGSSYLISWISSSLNSSTMTIKLRDESKICSIGTVGCQNDFVIAYGLKNNGSYFWDTRQKMGGSSTGPNSVTVLPGNKYKIVICKDYTETCDASDTNFTIAQ